MSSACSKGVCLFVSLYNTARIAQWLSRYGIWLFDFALVLCDIHDTLILIVDTYVTIPASPRSRYTAVYRSSTKYRETARVSTIPCRSYHLATCTLQACDAETNSKVAENHNHSTTMSARAAVNKYNPISYFCISAALFDYTRKHRHWNCTAHFRYRGSIEYRDTWDGIVIVAAVSVIAQHYLLTTRLLWPAILCVCVLYIVTLLFCMTPVCGCVCVVSAVQYSHSALMKLQISWIHY